MYHYLILFSIINSIYSENHRSIIKYEHIAQELEIQFLIAKYKLVSQNFGVLTFMFGFFGSFKKRKKKITSVFVTPSNSTTSGQHSNHHPQHANIRFSFPKQSKLKLCGSEK